MEPDNASAGQSYGLGDVWAELSLHNLYFPYFAIGVDNCNRLTPDESNFSPSKTPVSPYSQDRRVLQLFYNSNPDYKLQMGLRYGFTSYKWSVENVTVDEGYWDDPSHFAIMNQRSTSGYLEVTFGLKVLVWKNILIVPRSTLVMSESVIPTESIRWVV